MNKTSLILMLMFTFVFIGGVLAQSDVSYVLTLNYDGKTFSVDSINLVEGKTLKDAFEPSEGFTLKILDNNDNILYSDVFIANLIPIREAPDYFFDDSGEQVVFDDAEDFEEIRETSIVLTLPYFENAEKIQIYDSNNQLVLKFLIEDEFNKRRFNFRDNIIYFIIGLIILMLIVIIVYKRKIIFKKIKKVAKKEEKRIAELEKSIEEHKQHIAELKKEHKKEFKKHSRK